MILRTYTRIFTADLESTVATLKAVHGTQPHLWLNYDPLTLVGIGDVLSAAASAPGSWRTSTEFSREDWPEAAIFSSAANLTLSA